MVAFVGSAGARGASGLVGTIPIELLEFAVPSLVVLAGDMSVSGGSAATKLAEREEPSFLSKSFDSRLPPREKPIVRFSFQFSHVSHVTKTIAVVGIVTVQYTQKLEDMLSVDVSVTVKNTDMLKIAYHMSRCQPLLQQNIQQGFLPRSLLLAGIPWSQSQ